MSVDIWGGIECTTNRVRDTYYHQLDLNKHAEYIGDLDLIADLGVKTLRYPALWERLSPHKNGDINWTWLDERLARLRDLNIEPILGLVHHGSGPEHTDLTQKSFAEGLEYYAAAVAARYPWVKYYTPVNEPLTTARFSSLYGHWFPHHRDNKVFLKTLVNQCEATVRAMNAIKQTNSEAKLVQTEDIGKAYSTPSLQWQADWENLRRFWSIDLLSGEIHNNEAFMNFAQQNEFEDFQLTGTSPPDIIGINYYITSSRFLDHNIDLYPRWLHGETGYVDTESVRVREAGIPRFSEIIQDVWHRYRLPIALTEVHINSCAANQIRWFVNAYNDALCCKADGIDVRAVTTWGMFGLFSWDKLVCSLDGCYEPGVFDVRLPYPHKTDLFYAIQEIIQGGEVPTSPGWWEMSERIYYGFTR